MKIKTFKDPYDLGFRTTHKREIELDKGITVLVGCNGLGKSTLLLNIKEHCRQNKIGCVSFDGMLDDKRSGMSKALYFNNTDLLGQFYSSSEGESVLLSFGVFCSNLKAKLSKIKSKTKVILIDAIDSGLSVDGILEVKDVLECIIQDEESLGNTLYIIVSANNYATTQIGKSFDISKGVYKSFKTYNSYYKYILRTRQEKNERYAKLNSKMEV